MITNMVMSAAVWFWLIAMFALPTHPSTTIKVFTTRAIAIVLNETGTEFEKTKSYKLEVTTDIAIRMVRKIQAGKLFDVLVASPEQITALVKEGKIITQSKTNLAQSGIEVAVRAGAAKPDLSSVEALGSSVISTHFLLLLGRNYLSN